MALHGLKDVLDLVPSVRHAFAYGSAVNWQPGLYTRDSSHHQLVDFIMAVDNTKDWHEQVQTHPCCCYSSAAVLGASAPYADFSYNRCSSAEYIQEPKALFFPGCLWHINGMRHLPQQSEHECLVKHSNKCVHPGVGQRRPIRSSSALQHCHPMGTPGMHNAILHEDAVCSSILCRHPSNMPGFKLSGLLNQEAPITTASTHLLGQSHLTSHAGHQIWCHQRQGLVQRSL